MTIDPRYVRNYAKIKHDFELFCSTCLKIRDKYGNLVPLVLNSAQKLLHGRIEDQLRRTGRVRVLVDKGRQQGISTYVQARYYWKSSFNKGKNVYILAHKRDSTDALFSIVNRYHENNPFAPSTGNCSAQSLVFDQIKSTYTVATAGEVAGGRGRTNSLFHGSEVAFWPNASDHFSASVQTIPDLDGTEIILESTANGVTGEFYERWMRAVAGEGDYEAVFIPWFLQTEYSRNVDSSFKLRKEREGMFSEEEYAKSFNLTNQQMAWRRHKILELGSVSTFDQEYPATAELSFQQSSDGCYQDAGDVLRARKRTGVPSVGPLILGVDPAGEGGDRFAIAFRRGYSVDQVIYKNKVRHDEAVEWLIEVIDEYDPAVVFIDAGGLGRAILSSLRGRGARYSAPFVRAVNFGDTSQAKKANKNRPGPVNRRAEMQQRVKEWLALAEGVSLPDSTEKESGKGYYIATGDVIQADLLETRIKKNLVNDLQLEAKQEIRNRGARSPDTADAIGLTFAETTNITEWSEGKKRRNQYVEDSPQPITIKNDPSRFGEDYYEASDDVDNGWMA